VLREEVGVAFLDETLRWLSRYIDSRVAAQVFIFIIALKIAAAGIYMTVFTIFITLFVVLNFIRHFMLPLSSVVALCVDLIWFDCHGQMVSTIAPLATLNKRHVNGSAKLP
jgi:hypothetical protein